MFLLSCLFESRHAFSVRSNSQLLQSLPQNRIPKEDAICAIDELEESLKKDQVDQNLILGSKWQLIFSSLLNDGYFPISEICDFSDNKFSLISFWKNIPLGSFEGESKVVSQKPLTIAFQNSFYSLGPFKFKVPPKPRSYKFILANEDIAVARSLPSGGGTILKRVK